MINEHYRYTEVRIDQANQLCEIADLVNGVLQKLVSVGRVNIALNANYILLLFYIYIDTLQRMKRILDVLGYGVLYRSLLFPKINAFLIRVLFSMIIQENCQYYH